MSEVHGIQSDDILPRTVVIGGGTGGSTVISGLCERFGERLTGIANMVDNGGSTGLLRDQYGALPPGDLRQMLAAMTPPGPKQLALRKLLGHRFPEGANGERSLMGHNLGNLIITGLTQEYEGDITEAVRVIGQDMFDQKGRVLPVFNENRGLVIDTLERDVIRGEKELTESKFLSLMGCKVGYSSSPTRISPETDAAVRAADVTILAPGGFYNSIAPCLAAEGMMEALQASGMVVLLVNLMNRHNLTVGYTVSDFAEEAERIIGAPVLDYVVYNTEVPDDATLKRYAGEDEHLVQYDKARLDDAHYRALARELISKTEVERDPNDIMGSQRSLVRHDSIKVGQVIVGLQGNRD